MFTHNLVLSANKSIKLSDHLFSRGALSGQQVVSSFMPHTTHCLAFYG